MFISIYGFPSWLSGKEPTCNAGDIRDAVLIPESGRSSGGGNGNPLQYSCRGNPMDRGAWWATVYGVAKSWIQQHTCISIYIFPLYTQIYNEVYNGNTYSYTYIPNLFLSKLIGIYILIVTDQKFYGGSIKL